MKGSVKSFLVLLVAWVGFGGGWLRAQEVTGTWQGTLTVPGGKELRTIVKISREEGGGLKTLFYSIDQGSRAMTADKTRLQGGALTVELPMIGATYEAKLSGDGSSLTGIFTQGQSALPLVLVHATKETAWEIPAAPAPPKLMAADANPSFEVATIKPNNSGASSMQGLTLNGRNFATRNSSLGDLISFAYDVQLRQIVGAPDWLDKDRYDVAAVPDVEGAPNPQQLKAMLRKLIAERFKLTFHREQRELPAFVLTEAKGGQKLAPTQMSGPLPGIGLSPGKTGVTISVMNGTIADFSGFLQSLVLDRPVVDQTGLKGKYDFHFTFTPDETQFNGRPPRLNGEVAGSDAMPGLFEAMPQQVGLKLEAKKTAVEVLVIDQVEKPSGN